MKPHYQQALVNTVALVMMALAACPVQAGERILINDHWQFKQGDPGQQSAQFLYDVRPDITESTDSRAPDAMAVEAERVAGGAARVLKPWILPSGNAFIKDAAQRHVRPAREPEVDTSYARLDLNDQAWRTVQLPHDWAIEGPFLATGPHGSMGRLTSWGPAWYRRKLTLAPADAGKSVFLDVDGAMSYATVWVNGHLAGGWPYGYNSFRIDLTPYLSAGGQNQLAIRVDSPPESSRWYPGAGLYRNVWLTKTAPVHVGQWGVRVHTPDVSAAQARVAWETTLDNDGSAPATVRVTTQLFALDAQGRKAPAAVATLVSAPTVVAPGRHAAVAGEAIIAHPRLWGPLPAQTPNRYVAVTTVRLGDAVVDREETPFGIRSVRYDPVAGVLINGQRVPLQGVNNHHDLGALGTAFNVRAAQRQLEMLQEMGFNALRMSHNPPDPQLLELCDRMGILVVDEIFDSWDRKKSPLGFHLIFPDWYEQDLRALIRRDRNHPSVIIWSVGNEVGEQYTGEPGAAVGRRLVQIAHEEDPARPATSAMNYAKADMPLPAAVDVIGLNYQGSGIRTLPGQFPAFHAAFPDKMIFHTESAAAVSSRGAYQFPVPGAGSLPVRPGSGGDPVAQQVSAYELFATDFGSSADRAFASLDEHPYAAGEFVWTGWDYLGEPTPYYGARSSYFGIIDLAGFKKDRFYLYQSRWRPELPMVHILPHWTWPERVGEVTPVHVFTSGDEAELFINGKSQGRQKKAPFSYRLRWDYVTYAPGELTVVAYKGGKEWARTAVKTASAPAQLAAAADRATIAADGRDLSFITVSVQDGAGNIAPRASDRVRFSIEGPGELVATDNGDATSFESFQSPARAAFNGLVLAIVRARPGARGDITVRASAEGLKDAAVTVHTSASTD